MIESIVPAVIALITGGFILTSKTNEKIAALDKRVDEVELRVVSNYVSKGELQMALDRKEGHMVRIENKLDELVRK